MNEEVQEFVKNIGAIVEVWTVIYGQFIAHGYSPKDALMHTEAFTRAAIVPLAGLNGDKKEGK